MDRESVDKFLAEADDVIADWNPGIDAAGWKADGSHQLPDVPRDSMYDSGGVDGVGWDALHRWNGVDWDALGVDWDALVHRWNANGSHRLQPLDRLRVTRVMGNGRLVIATTEHPACVEPRASGCERCSQEIVEALLEPDPEVRRAVAFYRTRSGLSDYESQVWVSLNSRAYYSLMSDRRMAEFVRCSPAGPRFVRDIEIRREIPAEQIHYNIPMREWGSETYPSSIARIFDIPESML